MNALTTTADIVGEQPPLRSDRSANSVHTEWRIAGQDQSRDDQLARVLAWAARSPFYKIRNGFETPFPGIDQFHDLAPTTKQDLRDAYPFGMLAVPRSELSTYHESSGTAGRATASYYTESDWDDLTERFARKWIPMSANDTVLVRTPYALLLTGHLAHAAARSRGATVVPGDNRSLAMPFSRVVRVLRDLDVSLSWSVPTEPLLWAESARALGMDIANEFRSLRALYVGGEPMSDARRRRISEIWGVPVIEEYGATEVGSIAGECPHRRLHLWSDRLHAEILDPKTGSISTEGRGQLLITPLQREAMPLLRYNIEDTVELTNQPCPCGWPFPMLTVEGRTSFGYSVNGFRLGPRALEDVVFSLPADYGVLFWRARALPDRLSLQIEVAPALARQAASELIDLIGNRFGLRADVEALRPGDLVPTHVLTGQQDVVKPRSLFGEHEDWDKAVLYY